MIIHMTLTEGGAWWQVDVSNTDNLKSILNTGTWNGVKIYSVMFFYEKHPMIYDFTLRGWR